MLAGAALPAVAVAAWLDGRAHSWAPVLLALPWLALRGAGAIRERRRGLAEGAFLAAWIALLPWLAAAIAALCPWAFRNAVHADQALSPTPGRRETIFPGPTPSPGTRGCGVTRTGRRGRLSPEG
jgi:hypothetical protein